MTIDFKKFASLQQQSKNSFVNQKQLMKKVMAGQTVLCITCKQPLKLYTPESKKTTGIRCVKGCSDIQLDFV